MKFARAFLTLLALALPAAALAAPVELLVFAPSLNRVVGYGVIVNGELKLTVNGYNGRVSGILLGDKPIRVSGTLSNGKLTFVGPKGGFKDVAGILASYGVTAKVSVTRVNTAAVVAGTTTTTPASSGNAGSPANGSNDKTNAPTSTGSGSSTGSGNNTGNGKTSAPGQADKGSEPATPGKSGTAPGQTKDNSGTPGKSGAAPAQDTKDDATPGKSNAAPVQDKKEAPGQDKKEVAEDAPGKSGGAPGQQKADTTPPAKEKAK